jgi:hypothetical protein
VYRRHTARVVIAALWLVPVWWLGTFALDASPDGVPVPTGQRIVYAALCLPFLVLAVRTFRIGVLTREWGVVVRGVLWTWRLRWEEIAAFEWGEWRGAGGFDCGVVRREDGSQVTAFALNPPFEIHAGQDRRVPDMLAALNQELARARGWSSPPPAMVPGDPTPPMARPLGGR